MKEAQSESVPEQILPTPGTGSHHVFQCFNRKQGAKRVNSSSMETVAQIPKYNLNEEQEKKLILREYRSLLRALKARIKPGDRKLIRHAFEMAADAHKTMRRKS